MAGGAIWRKVSCGGRCHLADASGEDLGRGHLHEQLRGRLPVPPALGLGLGSEDLGLGLK